MSIVKHINSKAPILVTGATGYVAGWVIKKLLDRGLCVHGTVRNLADRQKLQPLYDLAANSSGELKLFQADLLNRDDFAKAMQGCELVYHTASPIMRENTKDPYTDLYLPAVIGTKNILKQAMNIDSVKRVVITGSCTAMCTDNADLRDVESGIITEKDWNTTASLKYQPYYFSKTEAEKIAWELVQKQDKFDLICLNSSLVIGGGIDPKATSASFAIVKQLGDGSMKNGVPRIGVGVVDVQDLAEAHYQAGFTPNAAGRYIISGHNTDFLALAQVLLPKYGADYPIPRKAIPKILAWLFGPIMDKSLTRKIIMRNVNIAWYGDNSKGINELGLNYRPLEQSMNDFFAAMIDSGMIKK